MSPKEKLEALKLIGKMPKDEVWDGKSLRDTFLENIGSMKQVGA